MRAFFLSLFIVLAQMMSAQTEPSKGDYVLKQRVGYVKADYIFKNRKVFYNYDPASKKDAVSYQQDAKMTKELFALVDAAGLDKMTSLNENSLILEQGDHEFSVIEYRKGDKKYRIAWDPVTVDDNSKKLNEIADKMNSFW